MINLRHVLKQATNVNKGVIIRNNHLLHSETYVNGRWISAADNKVFEVKNPADGSIVGCVPDMTAKDAEKAIEHAYKAFQTWQDTTPKERSQILRKWYNLMNENSEDIAHIITLESGKAMHDSRADVAYGNSFAEWFSEQARRIDGEIIHAPVKTKLMFLTKQPIGVAALITPWNFPHALVVRKASAALAAGCTVVIKPAEDTPLTALAIAELADLAGFPPGVLNVVTSSRTNAPSIGNEFCENSKVAGISFTGSTQVGKLLYKSCANGVKRLALELGGNAPFIVFETADIDKAVEGAKTSKFRNCGQTCVSANRFLIHESIFDEFVNKFKTEIEKMKVGNGLDEKVVIGPLVNKAQADKVNNIVLDAVKKGAQVITGGKPLNDLGELFYQPTLLTNITRDMLCYNEEVFGPIACCNSFKTEEEALKIANETTRGLASYFYSQDVAQIFRVSKRLEAGMVGVNEGLISCAEAAFGGIKESGLGREGSRHGIDDFVYMKYTCLGSM